MLKEVGAGVVRVAYEETGVHTGTPVLLLHGFPYDVHAYDEVAPVLVSAGCRVITPYLRGFGPTRFRSADTPRSGQQAALAYDLIALMDALAIPRAGPRRVRLGRTCCLYRRCAVARPGTWARMGGGNGYNIQDIAR